MVYDVPGADSDGDGFASPTDCLDADAAVHPGAAEVSTNLIDDDCDGAMLCRPDADRDGLYGPAITTARWWTCGLGGDDCDDSNKNIGREVAGDNVDGDCDGAELCRVDADQDGFADGVASARACPRDLQEAPRDMTPLGDVNGDGYDDVISGEHVLYYGSERGLVGSNTLGQPDDSLIDHADMDGDGLQDIVGWSQRSRTVLIWFGGAASPNTPDITWTAPCGDDMYAAFRVLGDINGDSTDELALLTCADAPVISAPGRSVVSVANLPSTVLYDGMLQPAGDVNGDGMADVVWTGAGGPDVRFGPALDQPGAPLPSGCAGMLPAWQPFATATPGTELMRVFPLGDLNADGRDEIWFDYVAEDCTMNGVWGIDSNSVKPFGRPYITYAMGAGDLDGDGIDDAIGSFMGSGASLYHEYSFAWLSSVGGMVRPLLDLGQIAGVGDLNGDGRGEIYTEMGIGDITSVFPDCHPHDPRSLAVIPAPLTCEGVATCWPDHDRDGHATAGPAELAGSCELVGTPLPVDDCDDAAADRHPGLADPPDGVDQDCDGVEAMTLAARAAGRDVRVQVAGGPPSAPVALWVSTIGPGAGACPAGGGVARSARHR